MEKQEKPRRKRWKRIRNISIIIVILAAAGYFAVRFYYPYGEGVKTGQLNYVVYKGLIFKTYEGKLVQTGFWSNASGSLQSNEFLFSIADAGIADTLMNAGGRQVELHYTEYLGALPWRGYSRYVVDRIIRISDVHTGEEFPAGR